MSETSVKGKEVLIKRTPMVLFSMFNDLSRLVMSVPEEYRNEITADKDSIKVNHRGIHLGLVIDKREPFSLVALKDDGESFLPFYISFHMVPVGIDSTLFHIELSAKLDFMMKMMIGSKLQETVDSITDQIEKALNTGTVDFHSASKEVFS